MIFRTFSKVLKLNVNSLIYAIHSVHPVWFLVSSLTFIWVREEPLVSCFRLFFWFIFWFLSLLKLTCSDSWPDVFLLEMLWYWRTPRTWVAFWLEDWQLLKGMKWYLRMKKRNPSFLRRISAGCWLTMRSWNLRYIVFFAIWDISLWTFYVTSAGNCTPSIHNCFLLCCWLHTF